MTNPTDQTNLEPTRPNPTQPDQPVRKPGPGDRHPAAWRVYERGGFTVCGAVLDYPDSGYSRFYEKKLS